MARLNFILLAALVGVAVAQPQRNLNYPTTKRPAPGSPTTAAPVTPAPTTAAPATPAPTTPAPSTSTTPQAAPYPAAGFRPGRAFNLPTEGRKAPEQPSTNYGPPADKYGPPADDSTTTVQPALDETTTVIADESTAKIPKGLQPGFYFIQLPGGGIQKIALLTNAAVVEFPAEAAVAVEEKESNERDVENDDDDKEPTSTQNPVIPTISTPGRTIQVWPPVQVVEAQPVDAGNDKLVKPLRSERIVAVEPVLYVQPKSYSYVSQLRTW